MLVSYIASDGSRARQPRSVQRELRQGCPEAKENRGESRYIGRLHLLQGPLPLDTSEAAQAIAILSAFW
jgi:hypothetical protein